MIVDIRQLDEPTGRLSSNEVVSFTDHFGEDAPIDCRVELSYRHSGGAYYFHGVLSGRLNTLCHRCLEPVAYPVSGEFDVVVRKSLERREPDPTSGDDSDDFVTLGLNDYEVSFDPFIQENLIVNIPIQIVCRVDCLGLCPQCGANRNRESCNCVEAADSRWDALRKLKKEPDTPAE